MAEYKVEEIQIAPQRNEFGWFITIGMVDGYVLTIRSDYKPTKAQARRMLENKMQREEKNFCKTMAALVK